MNRRVVAVAYRLRVAYGAARELKITVMTAALARVRYFGHIVMSQPNLRESGDRVFIY